jgi:hypothetical protein
MNIKHTFILVPSVLLLTACYDEPQTTTGEIEFIGTPSPLDDRHMLYAYTPSEAPSMLCVIVTSGITHKSPALTCFEKGVLNND